VTLPAFDDVAIHEEPVANGIALETEWMARAAATGRAAAHLWTARQCFVVPRSYERLSGWAKACAAAAAAGWPVHVRRSGGGLVPLGPGVLNLSLVWRSAPVASIDPHATYRDLCSAVGRALARLSINATTQAVAGSFCDGRFNLAVGGRKIAGTAQAWRRIGALNLVLAHALIIVNADSELLTEVANRFEAAAHGGRCYRADALTSVARAWCEAHAASATPTDLEKRLVDAMAQEIAAGHREVAA
jgi:lipoate-protein ligase A